MTLSWLLLAALVAPPRHPHPAPHLMRPPTRPALHKHFAWVVVRTKTWSGKQFVDLGLLARYKWVLEANSR